MDQSEIFIVGGGFSGLLCARELASKNFPVKVIEEHNEIGYPNKCSGVVSLKTIETLNIPISKNLVENSFSKIIFYPPSGKGVTVNFKTKNIFVLNRYNIDSYLAEEAIKNGAEISLLTKMTSFSQNDTCVKIKLTGDQSLTSSYLIDARGAFSYVNKLGLYNGVQLYAYYKDFETDAIHVFFNKSIAPGFFAWLIPLNENLAKIGLASKQNTFEFTKIFLKKIGVKNFLKIYFSPIVLGGVRQNLVEGRVLYVGDSAGQTKPTTGGGIYFGGMGALLLAKAIANKISDPKISLVDEYEKIWFSIFKNEIKLMKFARKLYENMDNDKIERLFSIAKEFLSTKDVLEIDYDLHLSSIIKFIGVRNTLKICKEVFGNVVANRLKKFNNLIK
ncbi:MAG: NAD(P)/FAD-dependent oxidoreductase [Nitrososphaeria archaeon]